MAVFMLTTSSLLALSFTEQIPTAKIRVKASSVDEARNIGRYASSCFLLLDETLGIEGIPGQTVEIVAQAEATCTRTGLTITFGGQTSVLDFTYHVMCAMVQRRVSDLFPQGKGKGNGPLACFLSAALAHRNAMRIRNAGGIALDLDYLPAQHQFENSCFPDLILLLTTSVPPDFTGLFQCYAMHCDLILYAFDKTNLKCQKMCRRLLEMEAYERPPVSAVNFLLGSSLPQGTTPQWWYQQNIRQVANRGRPSSNAQVIAAKVAELEILPVVSPLRVDAVMHVRLENAPEAFTDLRTDNGALMKRRRDFMQLAIAAPPLMRSALEGYGNAIGSLLEGDVKNFHRRLSLARKEFDEAMKRQQTVEQLMDAFERDNIPVSTRFAPFLQIVRRHQEVLQEIFPLPAPSRSQN